jgi:nitrogen regulatory protein PII 2
VGATKEALEHMGFPSLTALSVIGRGKQRGIAGEVACELSPATLKQGRSAGMKYVPKRLLSLVVDDGEADRVVQTIIRMNQTAEIGDGRVFVCPVDDALRVRTEETGRQAIN